MTKIYSKAPLPFVGQKRMFLKQFRTVLDNIPNDGEGWIILDVFGGSGLLAHTAKTHKPKATKPHHNKPTTLSAINGIIQNDVG